MDKNKLIIHLQDTLKNLKATVAYIEYALLELEKDEN